LMTNMPMRRAKNDNMTDFDFLCPDATVESVAPSSTAFFWKIACIMSPMITDRDIARMARANPI